VPASTANGRKRKPLSIPLSLGFQGRAILNAKEHLSHFVLIGLFEHYNVKRVHIKAHSKLVWSMHQSVPLRDKVTQELTAVLPAVDDAGVEQENGPLASARLLS
jgi:hypothetical protein